MRTLEELAKDLALAKDVVSGAVVHDLIAHVQQQADQIATLTKRVDLEDASTRSLFARDIQAHGLVHALTARVAALESAGKVQTRAKLDEATALGVGTRVLIPGEVVEVDGQDGSLRVRYAAMGSDVYHVWFRPEHVRPAPAAPPPSAAPAPASDDYEARAKEMVTAWERSAGTGLPSLEERIAILLRTVDDEATAKAAEKARREERAACEAVCRRVAGEYEVVGAGARTASADECADRIAARGKDESPRTGQADG